MENVWRGRPRQEEQSRFEILVTLLDHDESEDVAIFAQHRLFSEKGRSYLTSSSTTLTYAILIGLMLTMFADILYLTHHLVRKLFYKQIIATAGSLLP